MNLKEEFQKLTKFYKEDNFEKIINHKLGTYFLKMHSISRPKLLEEFAKRMGITLPEFKGKGRSKKLLEFIFCQGIPEEEIDKFIIEIYEKIRKEIIGNEEELYSQLYKLKFFDWGGFYQNAVERTIVNDYVKKIRNYDLLLKVIEHDINPRITKYILCSWYNHWTSVLIEDIFNRHPDVIPAIGKVKKIDFFWNNFPFDLKVTYFPDEFMQLKRKEMGLKSELSELKEFAKKHNIYYDKKAKSREIFYELLMKISEDPSSEAKEFMENFYSIRKKIISETINNPKELIRWFYENQGVRRFDASCRFFLVLIDLDNLEDSWKLKRNKKLLKNEINKFLNNNNEINPDDMKITFNWDNREYTTYATILFVLKGDLD